MRAGRSKPVRAADLVDALPSADAVLTSLMCLQEVRGCPTAADGARDGGRGSRPRRSCLVPGCPVREDSRFYNARYRLCADHQSRLEVDVSKTPGVRLLMRFCHKCSKMEPLSAFDGSKHTCRRMLSEHNRRRRERYAMDRAAHAAEQRNYRDRAKARRAAEALAAVRAAGGGEGEATAAPAARRPQRSKPTAVWARAPGGASGFEEEEEYSEEEAEDDEMADARAAYDHAAGRSALTGAFGLAQAAPHGWPPPPAGAAAQVAGDGQLAQLWAELVSQSVAAGGAATQQQQQQQQQAYNAAAAAAFAAEQQQQHRAVGALPFNAAAFAAALQATAANQPNLRDAAAAAASLPPHNSLPEALAALLDQLQPPQPPPMPLPQIPPEQVPAAPLPQLAGNPALAALAQVLMAAPAAQQQQQQEQEQEASGAAVAALQHAQLMALTQTRFPSGASAHCGGGAADSDAGAAAAARLQPAAQPAGSALPPSLVLCREHSSARSGGSRWEHALAAAAAAQAGAAAGQAAPPAVPGSPVYRPAHVPPSSPELCDPERRNPDGTSLCTASLPDLTHSAVMARGEGAAAEELRARLRQAVAEARAAASSGPASTTTSSGVLAKLLQQRTAV